MPDYFYAADPKGEDALRAGYKYFGVACYVYGENVKGTVAVYRCHSIEGANHFYTTNRAEFNNAITNDVYTAECVGWYMFDNAVEGSVALKRWFSNDHDTNLYATTANEAKVSGLSSYTSQQVEGYVLGGNGAAQDGTRAIPLYWWYLS